jgi:hypothetical protein
MPCVEVLERIRIIEVYLVQILPDASIGEDEVLADPLRRTSAGGGLQPGGLFGDLAREPIK